MVLVPGMLQIVMGTIISAVFLFVQILASPHASSSDNQIASMGSFCMVMVFLCCYAFKNAALVDLPQMQERMSTELTETYVVDPIIISAILVSALFGTLLFSLLIFASTAEQEQQRLAEQARNARARRLRCVADGTEVSLGEPFILPKAPTDFKATYAMGNVTGTFHVFLSHVWGSGQDQMRIVKQRLLEMLPDAKVFLDVDDLAEGKGAEYVDASGLILIFCSAGYFASPNCMREVLRAVATKKPIIALLEPEAKHGALSHDEIRAHLIEAGGYYERWGLAAEVKSWGYALPNADEIHDALFANEPIEWNRIGHYQDVTMRLIADMMLACGSAAASGQKRSKETFLQGEMSRRKPTLPAPRAERMFHVFCSPNNAGGADLMREVADHFHMKIAISESIDELGACERCLVYLTGRTWTSGSASEAFAAQVHRAMDANVPLLLCHEMPGVGGQEARHGCMFDVLFACAEGATPESLLKAGIYSVIATPLKGGAWRNASMIMVALSLAEAPSERAKEEEASIPMSKSNAVSRLSSMARAWSVKPPRLLDEHSPPVDGGQLDAAVEEDAEVGLGARHVRPRKDDALVTCV